MRGDLVELLKDVARPAGVRVGEDVGGKRPAANDDSSPRRRPVSGRFRVPGLS